MAEDDQVDHRGPPNIYSVAQSVAVLRSEVAGLKENLGQRLDRIDKSVADALNRFASREEHEALKSDFKDFKSNIVKINVSVILLFIGAIAAVVFKNGLVH